MRLAILTDVHANLEALEACLADARAFGATRFAFLGDIVGYGADPEACVSRAREVLDSNGICVMGNHDAAASGDEAALAGMNEAAAAAIRWTRRALSDHAWAWLAALPLTHDEGQMLFVHADARRPEAWGYIDSAGEAERALRAVEARLIFCGHVHTTTLYQMHHMRPPQPFKPTHDRPVPLLSSRSWLAVIGAVGQPRDGDPRATYALLDMPAMVLTIRRVAYDVETAAGKIRAAGLPVRLADRLLHGG
jgi:diadenosine tetraphosphatase ApaH/serine/threonine PP2A family protein phosphatase